MTEGVRPAERALWAIAGGCQVRVWEREAKVVITRVAELHAPASCTVVRGGASLLGR